MLNGPVDPDDPSRFANHWKIKRVPGEFPLYVVGKKDGSQGCFFIRLFHERMSGVELGNSSTGIAFYGKLTPREVFRLLKSKVPPPLPQEISSDVECFNPRNGDKHLGVTLKRFLIENGHT